MTIFTLVLLVGETFAYETIDSHIMISQTRHHRPQTLNIILVDLEQILKNPKNLCGKEFSVQPS